MGVNLFQYKTISHFQPQKNSFLSTFLLSYFLTFYIYHHVVSRGKSPCEVGCRYAKISGAYCEITPAYSGISPAY